VDAVAASLRRDGIVARVERDQIVCDVRTIDPADDERVAEALARALAP
jgi:hypothetical protein